MKYVHAVFSPTGGTRKAADLLASEWPDAEFVDLTDPAPGSREISFSPEDSVLLAVPVYGGRVPQAAAERILSLRGNGARSVLLVVYGNRAYEDALLELHDLAQEAGFQCVGAAAAVGEHSIVREIAAGRPDTEDARELRAFGKAVLRLFAAQEPGPLQLPGNRPYREQGGAGFAAEAGPSCTECGLCAAGCPVEVIPQDHPDTTRPGCIACMRCVSVCPNGARSLPRPVLDKVRVMLTKAASVPKQNEFFLPEQSTEGETTG